MRLKYETLSLREQPLLHLCTAFVCGELLIHFYPLETGLLVGLAAGAVSLAAWLYKKTKVMASFLLLLGFGISGALQLKAANASIAPTGIRTLLESGQIDAEDPVRLAGYLDSPPELAPDRMYLDLRAEELELGLKKLGTEGIVHLVVPFKDGQDRQDYDALGLDYGTRLRVLAEVRQAKGFRNPGSPDFDLLLQFRGYDAVGVVKSPLLIEPRGLAVSNIYFNFLNVIRSKAISRILRAFRQPASGILAAALFGNQHFISHETAENFRIGGTYHLLVISGSHVAMLAMIAHHLLSLLISNRLIRFLASSSLLWSYALMIGAQPAITRATVMLTLALFGQLVFREISGLNILGGSAIVLLTWHPRDLFNPSFQLSFLTAAMIVAVAGPLLDRLKRAGEWVPASSTPYPPRLPAILLKLAELMFWNQRGFVLDQENSPIKFNLCKYSMAVRISRTRPGRVCQQIAAWCVSTVLATFIVQLGLLPVMISYFHRASLVSPLSNVIQGGLMSGLMLVGIVFLLLSLLGSTVAGLFVPLVNFLGWLTVHSTDFLVNTSWGNARVPDYGEAAIWIYTVFFLSLVVLVVCLVHWNPFTLKPLLSPGSLSGTLSKGLAGLSTFTVMALGTLIIWHPSGHVYDRGRLSLSFIDVGQGDSALIRFPRGKVMLLDAGGQIPRETNDTEDEFIEDRISIGEAGVSPPLWKLGIKQIDFIVASHAHSDHVQGFEDIGRSFLIREAIAGVIPEQAPQFDPFRKASRSVLMRGLRRGDSFSIDGVKVRVLAPFAGVEDEHLSTNNQSLVLSLTFGNRSFLLTGDAEKEIEARLVDEKTGLSCDVLKVGHHGSRSSSTVEFLRAVQPKIAVISVAYPSPFNHPHRETMEHLQAAGAKVLQTSRCGMITISTDGIDLRTETFVRCE